MSISGISFTNIPELRSIINFNRISIDIAETLRRLETGQRIISGKDDPAGLFSRELMRTDIRGIQAAQKNAMMANEFLSTAESGLANVSRMLIGDINNRDDNGLIGLIYDTTLPADMKKQQINDILNMIDGTIRSTTYNGKQIFDGSMSYRTSGVDGSKLGNVAVSNAIFDTAKGQTVDIAVLEQARKAALKIDDVVLSKPFDLQLIGKDGTMIELNGSSGSYTKDIMIDAINAKTSETGVIARSHGASIILESVDVGSDQSFTLVDLNKNMTITDMAGNAATTDTGRDVLVKINGQQVQGKGREIQHNSSDLSMSATISSTFGVGAKTQFNVAGGALFQLGKDVQTANQYRMALPSMTTSHLGGATGTLNELRSIDLDTDDGKARAYAIVNEAVNMVAVQRGTIGAVQKGVFDNNAKNLDIQLEKVSESEGLISNVDMALESSRLNRAELLAQSAMGAILYARQFNQFILSVLL